MLTEDIMAHAPQAETSRPTRDFGARHDHKPTKAIVGVAILIVLSFVFYELGGKTAVRHSSSLTQGHQAVASANHSGPNSNI